MGTLTETNIVNMGLAMIGGDLIDDIDANASETDRTELILARLFFDSARDAVQESANWPFAMDRDYLDTPEVTGPVGVQYSNKFSVPQGCLRVVQVSLDGSFKDDILWELEGGFILVDHDAIYVRFVTQITDTTLFPNTFSYALASYLAMVMSVPLTHSDKIFKQLQTQYAGLLNIAETTNSRQGTRRSTTNNSSLVKVR